MVVEKILHAEGKIVEWKWSSNSPLMQRPFWTSAYLIDKTLIDCGAPGSWDEMDAFIQNLPEENRPIQCYLTHAHEDHAGTGKLLIEKYHIPVYSPPESIDKLKSGFEYPQYRKMTWGDTFLDFNALPYTNSFTTPSGYQFEIIKLPGHSPDLCGFIERKQGWAFIGDMLLPEYQQLFGHTSDIQENIQIIAESLEKLYTFTEGISNLQIFVAGKGVFAGREIIRTRLEEIYASHRKVHEIFKSFDESLKFEKKIKKIVKELWGEESMFGGISNGELSRANFVKSCLNWDIY